MREQLDAGGTVKIGAPSYTHGAIKDADGRYRLHGTAACEAAGLTAGRRAASRAA